MASATKSFKKARNCLPKDILSKRQKTQQKNLIKEKRIDTIWFDRLTFTVNERTFE